MNLSFLVFAPNRAAGLPSAPRRVSMAASIVTAFGIGLASTTTPVTADATYGNLGENGAGVLGENYFSRDFFFVGAYQKFKTGSNPAYLTLESIDLGLSEGAAEGASRTVEVYQGPVTSGGPVLLATSSPTLVLGKNTYRFSFSSETPVTLSASTDYWVSPSSGSSSRWYQNLGNSAPTALNVSGYEFVEAGVINSGGFWTGSQIRQGLSLSINAVPEPATYAMALAGLACGGYSLFRRRKRA